jgi:formamidopyrimidine-DNA glycosylase
VLRARSGGGPEHRTTRAPAAQFAVTLVNREADQYDPPPRTDPEPEVPSPRPGAREHANRPGGSVVYAMPELPDVEGFRKVLDTCARNRRIQHVDVYDAGVLHDVGEQRFRSELEGRRFSRPERHGKWLLAPTGGPTVMLHFGMTGRLVCCRPDDERHAHDRVAFTVGRDRQLRYRDQRKLKGLWLADDAGIARTLDAQGPDAAAVGREDFEALLRRRRGAVKSSLTDQSVVAGIGNLLADEILWRSRLHPSRRADRLTDAELARLHRDMRSVLRSSMRAERVPPRGSWLTGHRDDPRGTCPRCGTGLEHGRTSGRGTVWCPHCQPKQQT